MGIAHVPSLVWNLSMSRQQPFAEEQHAALMQHYTFSRY